MSPNGDMVVNNSCRLHGRGGRRSTCDVERERRSWTELSRAGFDVYRDLVNTPAFFAMLPTVAECSGLDLGCGEGHNTRLLAERGANVVAIDIADVFVAAASAFGAGGVRYVIADGAVLPFASGSFDFVTAFMSLMDVEDPESTLREVAACARARRVRAVLGGAPCDGDSDPTLDQRRVWPARGAGHRGLLLRGLDHRAMDLRRRAC